MDTDTPVHAHNPARVAAVLIIFGLAWTVVAGVVVAMIAGLL